MFHEFQEKCVFVANYNFWKIKEMFVRRPSIWGASLKKLSRFRKVQKNVFGSLRGPPCEKNGNFQFFFKNLSLFLTYAPHPQD